MKKNRKELERIEWLVTSLLKMSRLDSGSETLKIKEVEQLKNILQFSKENKINKIKDEYLEEYYSKQREMKLRNREIRN